MYDQFGNVCGKGDALNFPFLNLNLNKLDKKAIKDRYCIDKCPKVKN